MTGPAHGDVDYDRHGEGYARLRRTDPRIAAQVHAALGEARTVLNVGAGSGSYEPTDREVVAIEPSAVMRAQRPAHLAPVVCAVAQALPLADAAVDASMAMVTIHQWTDVAAGLREMRRVTRGPVLILTIDPDAYARFWLNDYVPETIEVERRRLPTLEAIAQALGGEVTVAEVPTPIDCVDGFNEAYYARPERFLDPAVRRAQSFWGFVTPDVEARFVRTLAADLASGAWDARHGALRRQPFYDGSMRLLVAHRSIRNRNPSPPP